MFQTQFIEKIKTHFMFNNFFPKILLFVKLKVNQSHYRPEVPRGFQEVKVPRLRDSGTGWW